MRGGPLLVLPVAAALAAAMRGGHRQASKPLPPEPKAEESRPLAYFAAHCQRCHGPEGSRYPDDLASRTDAELKDAIREMAEGPGAAPLGEGGLELQLALHRAIRAKEPFLQIAGGENGRAVGYASSNAKPEQEGKGLPIKDGRFLAAPKGQVTTKAGPKTLAVPADAPGTSHPGDAKPSR